jgi:hypothetical protein
MSDQRIRELVAKLPKGTPRDPARIEPMIAQLRALWLSKPDWRLGQIIVNASTADPFYVEDDEMRDGLADLVDAARESRQ